MDTVTVPHPGNVNDPWPWLRTVARAMLVAGRESPEVPLMLHHSYEAYLGEGLQACFSKVREFGVEIQT